MLASKQDMTQETKQSKVGSHTAAECTVADHNASIQTGLNMQP